MLSKRIIAYDKNATHIKVRLHSNALERCISSHGSSLLHVHVCGKLL